MTDKRQKAANFKSNRGSKRDESILNQSIFLEYILRQKKKKNKNKTKQQKKKHLSFAEARSL